ncbi:MAG: PrgI family protein [Patescibacteria group bacterium]|nr:PrgI family protein [Patescibacteria group bacterium]
MKQFVVPQFISVESKILGPITVRQFVMLMVALLSSIVIYKFADFTLFLALSVFVFGIAGVFGFMKVNGRPIHYFLLNFIQNLMTPNRRVWCKDFSIREIRSRIKKDKKEDAVIPTVNRLKKSKLSELSLVIDTGGRYQGERE